MKNKVVKKLGAALLVSVMVMGTAACGAADAGNSAAGSSAAGSSTAGNSEAGKQESQTTEPEAVKEVEKPAEISWWTHDGLNEENGSEQWFSEFEKFTGIHLNHQFIPNNEYYDKFHRFLSGIHRIIDRKSAEKPVKA